MGNDFETSVPKAVVEKDSEFKIKTIQKPAVVGAGNAIQHAGESKNEKGVVVPETEPAWLDNRRPRDGPAEEILHDAGPPRDQGGGKKGDARISDLLERQRIHLVLSNSRKRVQATGIDILMDEEVDDVVVVDPTMDRRMAQILKFKQIANKLNRDIGLYWWKYYVYSPGLDGWLTKAGTALFGTMCRPR